MIRESVIDILVGAVLFFTLPVALVVALAWQATEWLYGLATRSGASTLP